MALTCSFSSSCFCPHRVTALAAAEGPNTICHTRINPLCRKTWLCNCSNITAVCLTLPKMSGTGCWSICAVGKCFCCPRKRVRLLRHWLNTGMASAGRQLNPVGSTRPTLLSKNMLGKNSSSFLQQLPGTEGASEAEAGSRTKVRSEINELGKGNMKQRERKTKR